MRVFGLTGGIATGKSTASRVLRRLGVPVIDADRVARDVVAPGSPALKQIADTFGAEVLAADGSLDRSAMRRRIVADPQARAALEAITHPAIHAAIAAQLGALRAQGAPYAVVDAALMVETGSYRQYAAVLVVSCSPATQLARLVQRDGMEEADARRLIGTQLPLADKEAVADVVIRNDGDLAGLEAQVRAAWTALVARDRGPGADQ